MPKNDENKESLYFVEFMQMCADAGYISEDTARDICIFAKYQGGVEAISPFPGDYPENEERFTDLLASIPPGKRTFSNYIVTEDNSYAVELARTVALIPKIWKSISPILFHAGTGQGKTHLLSAIAASSRQNTLFLNLNDLKMGYNYCTKTNKESQLLKWIISHNFLLLDDLQFVQNDIKFQHFLCSVFNQMPQGKSAIVLCSNSEVENMQDLDSTFFSRISSGISLELKKIDLPGRINILNQLFNNTGFGPDDEVISYIAINVSQNIRTLKAAGRAVLAYLLAAPSSHGISIGKVAEILESMNLRQYAHHTTTIDSTIDTASPQVGSEPNKENSEAQSTIETKTESAQSDVTSPYIVVDIDNEEVKADLDEINTIESHEEILEEKDTNAELPEGNDEELFKKALEATKVADSEVQTNALKQDNKVIPKILAKEESKKTIQNATSINVQIIALKNAAEKRISQLQDKKPNSPEISKLRLAISFLDQGKIESAMLALK